MANDTSRFPILRTLKATIAAVALGVDSATIVGRIPFDARVRAVRYYPNSTITGAATHNRTFSVVNKSDDGLGAVEVASLNMANGVNATAFVGKSITLDSTVEDRNVAAGDILVFVSTHIGNGIADPGGYVEIDYATGVGSED